MHRHYPLFGETHMKVHSVSDKLAVVTGGSSGLGFAIAKALAEQGFDLLLVARNIDKLHVAAQQIQSQYPVKVNVSSIDITDQQAVGQLAEIVHNIAPCADIVVNSAGIVSAGFLIDTPLQEWDRLYHFNIRGQISVLQTLLPDMKRQAQVDGNARHIVNISSAAAYTALPGMSAYASSKAGLIALSETLAHELSSDNIGVTVICPEFVNTPISGDTQVFGSMNTPKTRKIITKMFERSTVTSQQLAVKTLWAIEQKKNMLSVGRQATLAYYLKRLLPQVFFNYIERKFNAKTVTKVNRL